MRSEIQKAQRICRQIAVVQTKSYPKLAAFAEGRLEPGFVREVRDIEKAKSVLRSNRLIDSELYFDIVWLERFANDQLDDGLRNLQQHMDACHKSAPLIRGVSS